MRSVLLILASAMLLSLAVPAVSAHFVEVPLHELSQGAVPASDDPYVFTDACVVALDSNGDGAMDSGDTFLVGPVPGCPLP